MMVRSMALESSTGQTAQTTRENLKITTFMARDSISGVTEELMTVSGSSIRCTEQDFSLGMMAVGTRVSTSRIRNKEKECFTGLTVVSTKEAG